MVAGIITRPLAIAPGHTVNVRMWADDTENPTVVTPLGLTLSAAGALVTPASQETLAETLGAIETLAALADAGELKVKDAAGETALGLVRSHLRLFRPVDGDTGEFTDASAAQIGPLAAGRVWLKLSGGDGHIAIGETPAPTTSSSPPLAEGMDYYFEVDDGDVIAVIGAAGAAGTLHISTETAVPA